jgi:hypothetical protein
LCYEAKLKHAKPDLVVPWGDIGYAVDPAKKAAVAKNLSEIYQPALRQLAPNTGSYMNEADPTTPDWQTTFWGDKYDHLLSIKKKYDPDGLFWCVPCVGHELFTVTGGDGIGQDGGKICRL